MTRGSGNCKRMSASSLRLPHNETVRFFVLERGQILDNVTRRRERVSVLPHDVPFRGFHDALNGKQLFLVENQFPSLRRGLKLLVVRCGVTSRQKVKNINNFANSQC